MSQQLESPNPEILHVVERRTALTAEARALQKSHNHQLDEDWRPALAFGAPRRSMDDGRGRWSGTRYTSDVEVFR